MTELSFSDPSTTRPSLLGWTVSLLLHASVVVASLLFVAELKVRPPATFKWEVTVVAPSAPAQPETSAQTPPPPEPASEPEPAPQPPSARPPVREVRPVTRTVQQSVQQYTVEAQPIVEHRVLSTQPVTEAVVEHPLQPVGSAVQERTVKAEALVSQVPPMMTTANPVSVTSAPTTVHEAVHQPVAKIEQEAEYQVPVVTEAPVLSHPMPPVVARSLVEAEPPRTEQVERIAKLQPAATTLPVRSAPAPLPDYGWLAEDLRRRIEQLKRYPHLARLNHWEGRVLLRVVIQEDGALVSMDVVESSGFPTLDRDAQQVMRKAMPLTLKHPLGQPQVALEVPISYRLQ